MRLLVLLLLLQFADLGQSWNPFAQRGQSSLPRFEGPPLQMASSWESLSSQVLATTTGSSLAEEFAQRKLGLGSAHTDNDLRLFDSRPGEEPRVVFYKDRASWCPYCQKVWILLEEKRIPYRVEKINMRSYGDKPADFLKLCPNGLLPAIRLDGGTVQTDSLPIMMTLERTFTGPSHKSMWPSNAASAARADKLMRLERSLFGDWCNLVFRGGPGTSAVGRFESTMMAVDRELAQTPGPWFLDDLSIVDLTFVTHVERMCASCLYWSGLDIRASGRDKWPHIERWLEAFEARACYMATKSDYYTHVMDIPPQYGPGYSLPGSETAAKEIMGEDGNWELPLPPLSATSLEPVKHYPGEEAARHEAAFKLTINHDPIVRFACRGPGQPGRRQFQAPLADPFATPNLDFVPDVDCWLRAVTQALVTGSLEGDTPAPTDNEGRRAGLQAALAYLRDRVGVPRDMSYPAARQLRAHLQWAIAKC